MRRFRSIAAGVLALGGLAACNGGEDAFRNTMRTQALANCRAGSNAEAVRQLAEIGMTVDQLCTCAIDRYLRGASAEQLRQDRNNELPPALRNATMQCMAEQVQRRGGTLSAPAPAPAANGLATPPAGAPAEAGEDAEATGEDLNATGDK